MSVYNHKQQLGDARKSLGQHFLTSDIVPGWLADAGDITEGDIVLEIGPGTGALTKELLTRNATVIALEADTRAIAALEETFADDIASKKLVIFHTDVRTVALEEFGLTDHSFKVVANIPYYLSGHLFRSMLQNNIQPTDLVFLVQKEVARRGASSHAKGDKESLLSLALHAYGTVSYVRTVTSGHFNPPPKVDSAIIAVRNITRDHFIDVDENTFFTLLHIGFGQKRKQLLGNLSKSMRREMLHDVFSHLGIAHTIRAEDVPIHTWILLAKALAPHMPKEVIPI